MVDLVKTSSDLQGKTVRVELRKMKGHHHIGVVLGEDKIFKDTIIVGLTYTTVGNQPEPRPGRKYISFFHASRKQLTVI